MKVISKLIGLMFLLAAVFIVPSAAHTYHTSLTRIDFNKETKSLEIEINLFNHDLEKVLETKYKKRVDFEKTKEIDKLLFDYVSDTFIIKDSNDSKKKLVWVGKEIKTDLTTVFVEIAEIEKLEGLKLRNNIFIESFAEQTNLITIHSEDKKYDLVFSAGDDFKNFISEQKK